VLQSIGEKDLFQLMIAIIHYKSKLIKEKFANISRPKNIVKIMLIVLIVLVIVVGLVLWVVKSRMDDVDNDY